MAVKLPPKKRIDPRPQEVVGFDPMKIEILHRDEGQEYILAFEAEIHGTGVAYYEAIGYEVVTRMEGGPTIRGTKAKMGEPIVYLGHVLMTCSKEHRQMIDEHGIGGSGGQRKADLLEERMLDRSKAQDSFRGENRYRNVGHGISPTPFMKVSEADEEANPLD